MNTALHRNPHGFTIVELMIAAAIIALSAAIAAPSYARSRKRSQAASVLEDLRAIECAVDQWAIEHNKVAGNVASLSDLSSYIRTGSRLTQGADILGNSFGNSFSVDSMPRVPTPTFDTLSDVAPASFWSPFY